MLREANQELTVRTFFLNYFVKTCKNLSDAWDVNDICIE